MPLEEKISVFSKFKPCENERLACVRDYLFLLISPDKLSTQAVIVLNAEHDRFQRGDRTRCRLG
jgi:hypothetical protein